LNIKRPLDTNHGRAATRLVAHEGDPLALVAELPGRDQYEDIATFGTLDLVTVEGDRYPRVRECDCAFDDLSAVVSLVTKARYDTAISISHIFYSLLIWR
jgi:hypothetical protein